MDMHMRPSLFMVLLLALSACTGPQDDPFSAPLLAVERVNPYKDVYNGLSQDAIFQQYGTPSRRISLGKGQSILEYSNRLRRTTSSDQRVQENCTLRFWITGKQVTHVDDLGDTRVCLRFLATKKRDDAIEDKYWLKEYF